MQGQGTGEDRFLVYHRIRVPRFIVSRKRTPRRSLRRFSFPAFVKPLGEESSDGIAKASFGRNEKDTIERTRFLHGSLGCDVMIEEYIEGRELYVSVLGNRKVTVLPTRELFFGDVPETERSSQPPKPNGMVSIARNGVFGMDRPLRCPRQSKRRCPGSRDRLSRY